MEEEKALKAKRIKLAILAICLIVIVYTLIKKKVPLHVIKWIFGTRIMRFLMRVLFGYIY